jgi:hypothetical protein
VTWATTTQWFRQVSVVVLGIYGLGLNFEEAFEGGFHGGLGN